MQQVLVALESVIWKFVCSISIKKMKNIYLIGMRGVGKSTIGKLLAKKLERNFVDMDESIVRKAGIAISAMVDDKGWDYFRENEKEMVEKLVLQEDLIVGTGGGVLMFFDNAEKLKKSGSLILLTASPERIVERIAQSEDRPSLTGKHFSEEIADVWNERKETYEGNADKIISTDDFSPKQIVGEILAFLEELGQDNNPH